MIRFILLLAMLGAFGCARPTPIMLHTPIEIPVSVDQTEQGVVHILAPCATLTPYTDYRDFMAPGQTIVAGDVALVGHGGTFGTPGPDDNPSVLPPAEATLVFDNSEGCN